MNKPLFITSFLGLLVAGYLFISYVTPIPLICGEGGGCHTIEASPYASFIGLPTPLYGVLFYATLAALSLLSPSTQTKTLLKITTASGLIISAILMYIAYGVIQAFCIWCTTSAILSLIAFLLVWIKMSSLSPVLSSSGSSRSGTLQ